MKVDLPWRPASYTLEIGSEEIRSTLARNSPSCELSGTESRTDADANEPNNFRALLI